MTMLNSLLATLLLIGVGACTSTQPAYGPSANDRSTGYSDRAIEEGRYRVTYRDRSEEGARNGALRRAAEITLANGADWFQITNAYSEGSDRSSKPSVGIGGHTGSYGSGVGLGVSIPLGGSTRAEHSFEFITGSGAPTEGSDTYNARSVLGLASE